MRNLTTVKSNPTDMRVFELLKVHGKQLECSYSLESRGALWIFLRNKGLSFVFVMVTFACATLLFYAFVDNCLQGARFPFFSCSTSLFFGKTSIIFYHQNLFEQLSRHLLQCFSFLPRLPYQHPRSQLTNVHNHLVVERVRMSRWKPKNNKSFFGKKKNKEFYLC